MSSREPLTAASENSEPRPPQDSDDAPRSTLIFSGDEPPLSLPPTSRRPMVVVRSGDGANVPDWSSESPPPPAASEITAIPPVSTADAAAPSVPEPLPSEPAPSEPFPLARDLESPPPSAPVAIDRASVGSWEDPQLDSPELESGSMPLARPTEAASPRTPTVTPIPNATLANPAAPSVAPASLQTPAHSPERASSRGWLWKLAAPLAIAAAALLFLRSGSAPVPATPEPKPAVETRRTEAAPVVAPPAETTPSETVAAKKPEEPAPAASEASEAKPAEPAAPAARKSSPSGVTSKPVPPGATRVRLVVHPPDSKVGRRGVTQKPPYEFDVPKGKKVVLEVLHKGYTTRKVTLDGSSKRVVVGLTRPRARSSR